MLATPRTADNVISFFPFPDLEDKRLPLTDIMGDEVDDREGSDVIDRGLDIDRAAWKINVFEVESTSLMADCE